MSRLLYANSPLLAAVTYLLVRLLLLLLFNNNNIIIVTYYYRASSLPACSQSRTGGSIATAPAPL